VSISLLAQPLASLQAHTGLVELEYVLERMHVGHALLTSHERTDHVSLLEATVGSKLRDARGRRGVVLLGVCSQCQLGR
jgi:hypothetical protein